MRRRRWSEEAITAYLDGRMKPKTRRNFEAALAEDENLRQRVEATRQVIALVAQTPMHRPPRTYRLTPAMVAEKKKSPFFTTPTFQRLTAAAALLLIISASLLFARGAFYPQATKAPAAEAPSARQPAVMMGEPAVENAPTDRGAPIFGAASAITEETMLTGKNEAGDLSPLPTPGTPTLQTLPTPTAELADIEIGRAMPTAEPTPFPTERRIPPWLPIGGGLLLACLGGLLLLLYRRRQ